MIDDRRKREGMICSDFNLVILGQTDISSNVNGLKVLFSSGEKYNPLSKLFSGEGKALRGKDLLKPLIPKSSQATPWKDPNNGSVRNRA